MEVTPLGTKIKILRKRKKLTQTEVAEQLNVNAPTYCKYENNIHKPKEETLKKIAEILDVNLATFYDEGLFSIAKNFDLDEIIIGEPPLIQVNPEEPGKNVYLLKDILEKFNYTCCPFQSTFSVETIFPKEINLTISTEEKTLILSNSEIDQLYSNIEHYIHLLITEHLYNQSKNNL